MSSLLIALLRYIASGRVGACSGQEFSDQIDWAVQTGMGPTLDYVAHDLFQGSQLENDSRLRSSALTSRFRTADQTAAVAEIIQHCMQLSQPVTLLKGVSVSQQFYPLAHLRVMRDIDLLVAESDVQSVESVLRNLGYVQEALRPAEFFEKHHHSMPFFHREKKIWVEVHTRLFRYDRIYANLPVFSIDSIRKESRPSTFEELDVLRLSPELQLVYIAAHWSQGFQPVGGLFALLDILFLLKQEGARLDWGKLERWLDEPFLAAPVAAIFSYLHKNKALGLPDGLLDRLYTKNTVISNTGLSVLHKMMDHYYVFGSAPNRVFTEYNLSIIWGSAFQPSHWPMVTRLPWNVIFPPNDPQRYHLKRQWKRLLLSISRRE